MGVSRITIAELQRCLEHATREANFAAELTMRLDEGFYVVVTWPGSGEDRHVCCGGLTPEGRAAMLAALSECIKCAKASIGVLNAHKIKHDIKLPNLRELRKKYGGKA